MSYDFIYIGIPLCINLQIHINKKNHMPRGKTKVSQTLQYVMHKSKFQVLEYTQTSVGTKNISKMIAEHPSESPYIHSFFG